MELLMTTLGAELGEMTTWVDEVHEFQYRSRERLMEGEVKSHMIKPHKMLV